MLDNIVCITNRKLCQGNFLNQIELLCSEKIDKIILREKDLEPDEYAALSKQVIDIGNSFGTKIILHTFIDVAEKLGHKYIHTPYSVFCNNIDRLRNFDMAGVSIHTVDEAVEAEKMGASYVTASHIFETMCKEGLEPKGLDFLKNVCKAVDIPVYALGGIDFGKVQEVLDCGADKACMMSGLMKYKRG